MSDTENRTIKGGEFLIKDIPAQEIFSLEELSIMYFPLTYLQIKQITRGLKQHERI